MLKIFTIGHSNHSQETFLNMLQENGIEVLVDVRSYPGSKHKYISHFNKESMQVWLQERGIEYVHIPKVGGRRGKQHIVSPNGAWRNPSFRNYADYSLGNDFKEGLKELIELAKKYRIAMMCLEVDHYHCHR